MGFADFFVACQIGQRTGDAHDTVELRAERDSFFEHGSQGFLRFFLDAGFAIELADTQFCIDFALPVVLDFACGGKRVPIRLALDSPASCCINSAAERLGTSIVKSIRSSNGPEILLR